MSQKACLAKVSRDANQVSVKISIKTSSHEVSFTLLCTKEFQSKILGITFSFFLSLFSP